MSSSIWTQCAGASELRLLSVLAWRAVEAQHQVSTRKLVDTVEEQLLLEELIERVKPPGPGGGLHYLLATPFRYPPLGHGSRFGTRYEPGIWYGAESRRTMFSEVAYYRLVFLEGTRADLGTVAMDLTAFTTRIRTSRGVDLTQPPFDAHRGAIASPTRYDASQAIGRAMRRAGVEAFRYPSARDPDRGVGLGVLAPAVFRGVRPGRFETWHCTASRARVELLRRDYAAPLVFTFPREAFLVEGSLPAPAL